MSDKKHLSLSQRITIESSLKEGLSFNAIARELNKNCTTIAKEIKNHATFRKVGSFGKSFNDCKYRFTCMLSGCCNNPNCRSRFCRHCATCHKVCDRYEKEVCNRLLDPPYVCNGCKSRQQCTLEKKLYLAAHAQDEYELIRSESRQGIQISEEEAIRLDSIVSPLIEKGHSPHAISIHHADELMCNERTLYNYISLGILVARNIDLPRRVRFQKRKYKKERFKVDRKCRLGRTYQDFLDYMSSFPDTPIVEMDSVEGRKGGKVLLTLHFKAPQFMLAFIRDSNTSQSVIDIFNRLYIELLPDTFEKLFPLLLGDNGSEFSNPKAIEFDGQGNQRARVFYCDPSAPYQKGAAENNHTLIRRILPKGYSMDDLTQKDIDKVMNHINSYPRKALGDKSPYEIFSTIYGVEILNKLGASYISSDDIILRPSLIK